MSAVQDEHRGLHARLEPRMRRRSLLVLSGSLLVPVPLVMGGPRSARADALAPGTEAGEIVSIDTAASVIVLRIGRRERRARFGPLTRVRVNAMPAAVTDLRPGMRVIVRFAASETGRESAMLVSVDVPAPRDRPL